MINENFVIFAAVFNIIGAVSYVIPTLKGQTKPNKVSWFIWALAPLIAFSAEIEQGVGIRSLMTFMVGFTPLMVFLSSFINKKAYWKVSNFDIFCGVLSIIGLILWQITNIGNLAILFAVVADGLAALPTLVKAYHQPETESSNVFLMSAISALITLFTIKIWNFENSAFPIYIFVICALMYVLIEFKIGKRLNYDTKK